VWRWRCQRFALKEADDQMAGMVRLRHGHFATRLLGLSQRSAAPEGESLDPTDTLTALQNAVISLPAAIMSKSWRRHRTRLDERDA